MVGRDAIQRSAEQARDCALGRQRSQVGHPDWVAASMPAAIVVSRSAGTTLCGGSRAPQNSLASSRVRTSSRSVV